MSAKQFTMRAVKTTEYILKISPTEDEDLSEAEIRSGLVTGEMFFDRYAIVRRSDKAIVAKFGDTALPSSPWFVLSRNE